MSDARTAILSAIRGSLRRRQGEPPAPSLIAEAASLLRRRADATRPPPGAGTADAAFLARVTSPAIGATAERVAVLSDVPEAVRRYLATHALAADVALQPHPALAALDWSGIATHDRIGVDEPVAVGLALGGIAETGTLVFHSDAETPTLFTFLPLHHIVAVAVRNIWPWLEDYADAFAGLAQPRNVNLITGPSGTTDIEGALVRGAHGPGYLHVLLVGNRQTPSAS